MNNLQPLTQKIRWVFQKQKKSVPKECIVKALLCKAQKQGKLICEDRSQISVHSPDM